MNQYRQGDVFLEEVMNLPEGLKPLDRKIVAYGEVTGHAHRFNCHLAEDVELLEAADGTLYVRVNEKTPLVHEEHSTLKIPKGVYRYIPQREYTPVEVRRVQD